VKNLLDELGFSYLWNDLYVTRVQIDKVVERLYDQYYQVFFYSTLDNMLKLCTYKTIKTNICQEKYLS
jgi:5-bromo-4-chloroindolyl phosphate hydrolysis protein